MQKIYLYRAPKKREAPKRDKLISLAEAAEMLGIHRQTLRIWDNKGKLKSVRNKVNNYRMYRLSEIENICTVIENHDGTEAALLVKKSDEV